MKCILTVGASGSGKSTYADSLEDYVKIERDEARESLLGTRKNMSQEDQVTEHINFLIYQQASLKNNIIISDTNINKYFRNMLIEFLGKLGYSVELKVFSNSLQELLERNTDRGNNSVPEAVVRKQYYVLQEQISDGTLTLN